MVLLVNLALCDLEAVVVLFRHGARGPYVEKFDVNKTWTGKFKELTPVGARMHYLLGDAIRKRYVDTGFMNTSYRWDEMEVYSSYVNRTL